MTCVVADEELKPGSVVLEISADKDAYRFGFAQGGEVKSIATGATRYISTEVAGGFTGAYFALMLPVTEVKALPRRISTGLITLVLS